MPDFILGLIIGLVVGSICGVMLMAIVLSGKVRDLQIRNVELEREAGRVESPTGWLPQPTMVRGGTTSP